ncbi:MAG: hypothetical protein OEP95_01300 [Myxococcales bacterium]|nr:hypothetical protein [Myxococcales bacterium]
MDATLGFEATGLRAGSALAEGVGFAGLGNGAAFAWTGAGLGGGGSFARTGAGLDGGACA